MIKFIYQVEASEEAVNPIGFSFFNTVSNTFVTLHGMDTWRNQIEFAESITVDNHDLAVRCSNLIPKDWNKVKFKQV